MIALLVNLLILCLIIGVLYWIATLISGSLPPPLQKVPLILSKEDVHLRLGHRTVTPRQ